MSWIHVFFLRSPDSDWVTSIAYIIWLIRWISVSISISICISISPYLYLSVYIYIHIYIYGYIYIYIQIDKYCRCSILNSFHPDEWSLPTGFSTPRQSHLVCDQGTTGFWSTAGEQRVDGNPTWSPDVIYQDFWLIVLKYQEVDLFI